MAEKSMDFTYSADQNSVSVSAGIEAAADVFDKISTLDTPAELYNSFINSLQEQYDDQNSRSSDTGGGGSSSGGRGVSGGGAVSVPMVQENEQSESGFSDISGHWAEESINEMNIQGILNGYEDGTFRPEQNVTRAEAATIIYRVINFN